MRLLTGCGHGQALGTGLERVQLAGNDPGDWSPGAGEEEDVDADEGNGSTLGRKVLSACYCAGDGNNV
jgi:hypothetical protein